MAPKKQKQKNKKKSSSSNNDSTSGELIDVDPSRIRFQHSRIRPHFSGCGRSVISTLEAIRNGDITISEIPPIQVSQLINFLFIVIVIQVKLISYYRPLLTIGYCWSR